MSSEQLIERVHHELQQRFRIAGHGSVMRVQNALKLNSAYFRDLRRPGRSHFDLRVLLDALDVLEIAPSDFFASVFGGSDVLDVFCGEAMILFRRLRRRVSILELEESHDDERPPAIEDEAARTELVKLNSERRSDPSRVLRRTRTLINKVSRRMVPRVLAVHASAFRVMGRLDEAQMVLGRAIDRSRERGQGEVVAELALRAGYVLADRGEYQRAIDMSQRATVLYADNGDILGVGKSLVERGIWLFGLGEMEHALEVFQGALEPLATVDLESDLEARIYYASCLLSIARTHLLLGDLDPARQRAAEAREFSHDTGLEPDLVWMQASIAQEQGDLAAAERFLCEAVELYTPVAPLNTALATVELARLQLAQSRVDDSYQTAKTMLTVIGELEQTPLVSAALTEVLRIVLAGRGLTLTLLDHTLECLSTEQEKPEGHRQLPRPS